MLTGGRVLQEAASAGRCLSVLTEPEHGVINPNWKVLFDHGGIPILIKVVKSGIGMYSHKL